MKRDCDRAHDTGASIIISFTKKRTKTYKKTTRKTWPVCHVCVAEVERIEGFMSKVQVCERTHDTGATKNVSSF